MTRFSHILVPVDFSKPSLKALDYAIELSRDAKADLVVLHVVEPIYYPMTGEAYGMGYDLGNVYAEMERAAKSQLSRLAATLRARGTKARPLLCAGPPARTIVEQAKKLKADLIVMSTHGRTGLSHLLLGSVAEKVVRTASCSVLTVATRGSRAPKTMRRPPASTRNVRARPK